VLLTLAWTPPQDSQAGEALRSIEKLRCRVKPKAVAEKC
jgi:hypothetical protein